MVGVWKPSDPMEYTLLEELLALRDNARRTGHRVKDRVVKSR